MTAVRVSEDTAEQPCHTSRRTESAMSPEWVSVPGHTGVIPAEGSPGRGTASGEACACPEAQLTSGGGWAVWLAADHGGCGSHEGREPGEPWCGGVRSRPSVPPPRPDLPLTSCMTPAMSFTALSLVSSSVRGDSEASTQDMIPSAALSRRRFLKPPWCVGNCRGGTEAFSAAMSQVV